MTQEYLLSLLQKYRTGDASERTYYPVLESFLSSFSASDEQFLIMVESRNSSLGIPDFRVDNERGLLLGYIEAKDLGRDLDSLSPQEDKQIEGYKKEYPKLVVTNFIEFRLFENGEEVDRVKIAEPVTFQLGSPVVVNEGKFDGLLTRFFSTPIPKIYSARRLAELLAIKAHVLRSLIREEIDLSDDVTTTTEELLLAFRKSLRPDITEGEFADMYAQTVTYGLFSARLKSEGHEFTRLTAYEYIPSTIKLLKRIFHLIAGQEIPQHIKWQVDEIAEILANTDIEKIQEEFFTEGKGRDPIIHFYETFLATYDPKEREKRGVYYTPEPVVSYITRSVHELLKEKFGKTNGFADPSVTVLDPAGGTLTFLANAIALAKDEYVSRHGDGGWKSLVKEHILKNFYAFELLMAPYTIGHLKISLLLREMGYDMSADERFKLYLTNTLDFNEVETLPLLMLAQEITEESKHAYEVKTREKVMVVMGNPPYSGQSENKGEWIMDQMKEYKQINGQPLGERNPKWLNDDYVKFMRLAQWKVEQSQSGVLAFITNHAWLDNPTFRGMRASLLKTFDEIYILNLHGSVLKKEKTPEGEVDESVFDIQPGTAITLCVKTSKKSDDAKVFYRDLWGKRKEKYEWLETNSVTNTAWEKIKPSDPAYYFIERNERGWDVYKDFLAVNEIFPVNSVGIVTARDSLTIKDTPEQVWSIVRTFSSMEPETARSAYKLGKDVRDWKVSFAQEDLISNGLNEKRIVPILYRPFDTKYTYYTGKSRGFICMPRYEVMSNMLHKNISLVTMRQVALGEKYSHVLVTENITDNRTFLSAKGITQQLPLYTYSDQSGLLNESMKSANLKWSILPGWLSTLQLFTSKLSGNEIHSAESILYYIYAVLYSNTYREKYAVFLQADFPRIPFTKNVELFKQLAELGEELVQLHLLKFDSNGNENNRHLKLVSGSPSRFMGDGENTVEKVEYSEEEKRIYINSIQYFDNVSPEVWIYQIGGYQVLHKWLKDRKGRKLTLDDIDHYRKIITALSETITIQEKIDALYLELEKTL